MILGNELANDKLTSFGNSTIKKRDMKMLVIEPSNTTYPKTYICCFECYFKHKINNNHFNNNRNREKSLS